MCLGRQKLPKIPEPRPLAPAPEKTADSLKTSPTRSKRSKRSRLKSSSGGGGKNTGISSLRIPLKAMENLRY